NAIAQKADPRTQRQDEAKPCEATVKNNAMRVLVDTHAILWWLVDDKRLSKTARQILEDSTHVRLVSFASLWEIAIKMGAGRLLVKGLSFSELPPLLRDLEFQFLPIRIGDLERLDSLPWHHRDPFDRLLI